MRLDRFLTGQNISSRKEAKELAKAGLITVNGAVTKDTSSSINPETDLITVRGIPVQYKEHLYIMLNKPRGVVCATEDKRHRTVLELLPESLQRRDLFPAGRLDIDTEGFVLITDDGEFAHKMLSPKQHVSKTYRAVLAHGITEEEITRFCSGVTLENGTPCLPAKLTVLEDGGKPLVEVILYEGKFHQVKRMFQAVGNRVEALSRVKIGDLPLDPDLPSGGAREILHKECLLILGSNSGQK